MQRPWHFWPVTALAVLWGALGFADYALTQLRLPAYLSLFSPELVAYVSDLPARVTGAWAVGVSAALLGAIMMARQWRGAALVLAVAAAATVILTVWMLALSDPVFHAVAGWTGDLVMAVSALVAVLFWLYARAMHARGVLP